jgi:hypothetical protein
MTLGRLIDILICKRSSLILAQPAVVQLIASWVVHLLSNMIISAEVGNKADGTL